jgi:hypothetical protein
MVQQKDLKRLVRARMEKTGESYTAARAQIMRKPKKSKTAAASRAPISGYAATAGMSDEVVKEKTGRTWEGWLRALDVEGAAEMSHREIATLVNGKYKAGPWWGQMITVGYERIKGLRARGQQRDGLYAATKSKTFTVPIDALYEAWADARARKQWLEGKSVKVRTATAPKSMRLDWPDGGIIAVGFSAKGKGKSAVAIEHSRLPDKEAVNRIKQYWGERFDALGEFLDRRMQ